MAIKINMDQLITRDFRGAVDKLIESMDVSANTIGDYKTHATNFISFVEGRAFSRKILSDYKKTLQNTNGQYRATTINKKLTVAKQVLLELQDEGLISRDLSLRVKFLKTNKHKKYGFIEEKIKEIATRIVGDGSKIGLRTKALFSLFILQGLRVSEIASLSVVNLDLVSGYLKVHSKGMTGSFETIKLHPDTQTHLKNYISAYNPLEALFITNDKNRSSFTKMRIQKTFYRIFEALRIKGSVHNFRHYYITKLCQEFSPLDVMKLSRHKDVNSILSYYDDLQIDEVAEKSFKLFEEITNPLQIDSNREMI